MKKTVSIILALLIALCAVVPASAASEMPDLTAQAAIVMDLTTGEILYEKNADERMYPASLTKIMTGILTIENVSLGATLTADDEIAVVEPTVLRMKSGEQINAKDALYCMLVASCNDLAELFAKHISGSISEFAKLMNEKAAELGCTGTHFVNPHGLHDDDHYTTARDLSKIITYCMQNDLFREIVSLSEYTITRGPGATKPGSQETVKTTNWLLYNTSTAIFVGPDKRTPKYEGCIGVKTGYTEEAGGCMIAAAERDGTTILTIALGCSGDTRGIYERVVDSIKLLDWGLENFRTYTIMKAGADTGVVRVKRGEVRYVSTALRNDIVTTLETGESESSITTELVMRKSLDAPVERGDVCGTLKVLVDGQVKEEYDVVAVNAVKKGGPLSIFGIEDAVAKKIGKAAVMVLLILVVWFAMYVVFLKVESDRQKARKAAQAKAKQRYYDED